MLGRSNLVEMHSTLANISQYLFGVFAVATIYSLQSWTKRYTQDSSVRAIINKIINHKAMAIIWVIWLVLLTLVGALGGAISRGTGTGDPMSDWAVKTLVWTVVTQAPRAQTTNVGSTTTDMTITPPIEDKVVEAKKVEPTITAIIEAKAEVKAVAPVVKPVEAKPEPTPTATSYTMAQIATHNSEASCRSTIDGIVYDLSAFIAKHPWWDRNILRICGIDGSSAFNGKHGWQTKPEQTLAGFEIGVLTQ
jgi:cytochrome b involved in lipid metabolism